MSRPSVGDHGRAVSFCAPNSAAAAGSDVGDRTIIDETLRGVRRRNAASDKSRGASAATIGSVGNNKVPEGRVVDENEAFCHDQSLQIRARVRTRVYAGGPSRGTGGHRAEDESEPSNRHPAV